MKVEVLERQSILDIAVQHTGDVSNAFLIAKENSLAVSDYLVPGYELTIPNGLPFNRDILNYYNAKQINPATAITEINDEDPPQLGGIGYMQIGSNFIVN
ncbi:hypothetical protein [Chryseobacterium sp. R2A-55]|uniref:hypothetical protein n=1 Tax=Chryseobacterium sp. R2A-55 TaxID=2744445 RepID=UPI001F1648B3|nr:hypothetical protein [Chryseobacterium sp. R2A-55]